MQGWRPPSEASVIRAGGDRAGRPWPWGPPGPSGCCVGEWTELDGLCARRSGLRFWCLESLFQASSWLLVLFFFFFLSRNRQRCIPGRCFATSGNSLPKSSVGPGAPVWDRGDCGPLFFCFSSARAALMATGATVSSDSCACGVRATMCPKLRLKAVAIRSAVHPSC